MRSKNSREEIRGFSGLKNGRCQHPPSGPRQPLFGCLTARPRTAVRVGTFDLRITPVPTRGVATGSDRQSVLCELVGECTFHE